MAKWKTFSFCYFAKVPKIENVFKTMYFSDGVVRESLLIAASG